MPEYGNSVYSGLGNAVPAVGTPIADPDPKRDYLITGPGQFTPGIPQLLSPEADDIARNFGLGVYEAMLTDPAVASSFLSLKLGTVSGPVKVIPAIRPKGFREGKKFTPKPGAKVSPEEGRALEIAEFCERDINHLGRSFKSFLMEICDAPIIGNKLAEKTREEREFGPDKGKLTMKSVKVKPYKAWKYVVDSTLEPQSILAYVPPGVAGPIAPNGFLLVPMKKFIRFTWMQRDNDPRGTSALRAAYDFWNLKRQIIPFYYQHLRRFASPSLNAMMAAGDTASQFPIDPLTGQEVTTAKKVNPHTRFMQTLLAYQNNSVIVRPPGSELDVMEPSSNGESFLNAFDLFDRQICLAIGLQVRTSLEAKHGSKADSDTAENTRGLIIAYWREELSALISRQWFYESVKLNYGEEDAELFTPELRVGTTEEQDKPAMISAAASVGYQIGNSQLEEMDVLLDLPERDQEADLAHAQEQMQVQADMATQVAAAKGQAPPPGGQKGGVGGGE